MILEQSKASLTSHLDEYSNAIPHSAGNVQISPAIVELAIRFKNELIVGTNARSFALLCALKKVFQTRSQDSSKSTTRGGNEITEILDATRTYLKKVRRLSEGMDTIISHLKYAAINEQSDDKTLVTKIDDFIDQKILLADELIIKYGLDLIKEGDTILTYGRCSVIEKLLLESASRGKKFNLIVVDNPPFFEAKGLYIRVSKAGIPAIYTLITGVAYFMKKVTKVFLGAAAMLSNGNLVSRVGSAMIGCLANNYRKPLLVFCETYKFSARAQLDSLSENELADPERLLPKKDYPGIQMINLRYDLTPRHYINMVVTETGLIPPTSVPVILREFSKYQGISLPKN